MPQVRKDGVKSMNELIERLRGPLYGLNATSREAADALEAAQIEIKTLREQRAKEIDEARINAKETFYEGWRYAREEAEGIRIKRGAHGWWNASEAKRQLEQA